MKERSSFLERMMSLFAKFVPPVHASIDAWISMDLHDRSDARMANPRRTLQGLESSQARTGRKRGDGLRQAPSACASMCSFSAF